MIHQLWHAAIEHAVVAAVATANLVVATIAGLVQLAGAEVNDGLLTGAVLFVLGTGTGIAGWALVLLVRLSNVVSRLEATADDHERRLTSGGI